MCLYDTASSYSLDGGFILKERFTACFVLLQILKREPDMCHFAVQYIIFIEDCLFGQALSTRFLVPVNLF
jgi:hypothetical protein